ncbi:hypothetical protein ACIBKY_52475 [Nonomuraea sp. NPDC050394]|uniref:hypothetical protein n=1 Tax=Nonomuraea sp. NPDC050394 TaxID=3364363 RepID=UPI0037AE7A79
MSTTTEQNGFRSRLPDLTQAFPGLAALSGALRKAIWDGPVPKAVIGLVTLRAAQIACSRGHPPTTTTGRCGRSPWRPSRPRPDPPSGTASATDGGSRTGR